ncbi:MAG: choice-of-anchor J domain-containing protein [Saprospiraceae bacterium]|nr:choice-of-anchor J domain-containing protein [Saprospiraceae bacterium]
MKKLLPLLTTIFFGTNVAFGQVNPVNIITTEEGKVIRCFTSEKIEEARLQNPDIIERRTKLNTKIKKYSERNKHFEDAKNILPVYTIPVVVHIIYRTNNHNISDTRVYEQIQVLNEDYRRTNADAGNTPSTFAGIVADCEIEFCLATKDPSNNSTTGITRTQTSVNSIGQTNAYYSTAAGGKTIWDPSKYLNIWVCEMGGGILGFTYTPGNAPNGADGVVIGYQYFGKSGASAPFNRGRTTTHEVGHWLNLEHVWGAGNGGCNQDDYVNDTPVQTSSYGGCPSHPQSSCSSNDMFMNYMDYVNDNCMNSFTSGQKTRMRNAITVARPGLLTSQACVSAGDDAGISEINSPSGTICALTFIPEVTLKNHGGSPLTSVTINYRIDGGTTNTQAWTGNLTTAQTDLVQLPQQTVSQGTHTFEAWTTLPNGNADGDNSNDATNSSFSISGGGIPLPFQEGFEGTTFPGTGWTAINPDGDITWARTTIASKTGSASMFMDNWDYPVNGEPDYIILPSIDMSGSSSVTMTFELAYALYSATGYSDTLRIWGSDDCGQTWTELYEKFDSDLTTISSLQTTEFIPNSNNWRMETIDLTAYSNSPDVLIRFEHVCDYENNLYIDDINITSTPITSSTIADKERNILRVYPNPTSGILNIDLELAEKENVKVMVFNALGQQITQIIESDVVTGNYKINMSDLSKGIYQIKVVVNDETMSKKVLLK